MNTPLFPGTAPEARPDARKDGPPRDASDWFTAHCDGGSRGNPGPAGYGAVIEDPRGRVVARLSEFLGKQTNNFAEYSSLLAVLRWAIENGVKNLKVVSDSELMVNQMKGRYKVGSPSLKPLWEEARRLASRLRGFQMTHTLRNGNQEADKLANEAMDRSMGKKSTAAGGSGSPRNGGLFAVPPSGTPSAPGAKQTEPRPQRQVFEGLVKNGVVHLIEGELPDGILVKVIRE